MNNFFSIGTVGQTLEKVAKKAPDQVAYIYKDNKISFKEMDELSDRLAGSLLRMGYTKGDCIGLCAENQQEWLVVYYAAAKIGVIVVALSVNFGNSELEQIINHTSIKGIFSIGKQEHSKSDYVNLYFTMRETIPTVKDFIFINQEGFSGSLTFDSLLIPPVDETLLAEAKTKVGTDDILFLIFTSGTTGKFKGASLTHKNILASAQAQGLHMNTVTSKDVFSLLLPLSHVAGITVCVMMMLLKHGTCLLQSPKDPNTAIKEWALHKTTIIMGPPSLHILLEMSDELKTFQKEKIRMVISGGAPCDRTLFEKLRNLYPNSTLVHGYGMTELSGCISISPLDANFEDIVSFVGKPISGIQIRIVDEKGNGLSPGNKGEVWLKGEMLAQGYYNSPEATIESFDANGWFHTGDIGLINEKGYLSLLGRIKEMYIQGGYNVYPIEVENLLLQHPKIKVAAGIGIPDSLMGEVGCYFIVLEEEGKLSKKEIRAYCATHLASYKVPVRLEICDDLPFTASGKVCKDQLKAEFA